MAIQYGAAHSGIIDSALKSGIDVVDVFPAGLSLAEFNEKYEHQRLVYSQYATAHFKQRIIPIAIRNFVFSGSRLGSYLEVAIEPTHSNTEVLRGLAIE